MKKTAVLLALSGMFAVNAFAQPVLTAASYSTWSAPRTDTVRDAGIITIVPAANAIWDLSANTYGGISRNAYMAGGLAVFPGSSFYTNDHVEVAAGIDFDVKRYHGIGTQGIRTLGLSFTRQSISLAPATGSVMDSLIFEAQNIAYTNPETKLSFPATAGSNWSSSYDVSTNFKLNAPSMGFNNTPGTTKVSYSRTDSVKGWGTMRLKAMDGSVSAPISVLAVKVKTTAVDSFFLAGAPMDPTLLSAVGATQGNSVSTYTISYYRAAEVTPLLEVIYNDATYTNAAGGWAHMNRLPVASGVGTLSLGKGPLVYPNPIRNHNFNIELNDAGSHSWSYELVNMNGQKIEAGPLLPVKGNTAVQLNAARTPGMYYLTIFKNGQAENSLPVLLQD